MEITQIPAWVQKEKAMNLATRSALLNLKMQLKLANKSVQLEILGEMRNIIDQAEPYKFRDIHNESTENWPLAVFIKDGERLVPVRTCERSTHEGCAVMVMKAV